MFEWLRSWLERGPRETGGDDAEGEGQLALRSRVRALELELEERDRRIARLESELQRRGSAAREQVSRSVEDRMERLLTDAAGPVTQLVTQIHLVEREGRDVETEDVLRVAKQLIRMLERRGLELFEEVGQTVAYDPNRHELLDAEQAARPGQSAIVRFPGAAFGGRVIRKASVETTGT